MDAWGDESEVWRWAIGNSVRWSGMATTQETRATQTILTVDIFTSSRMNWIALAELASALLITQADF